MPSLLAHLRAEARRRWPAWLAVVVLVGVVGGLVLGAAAGARRTHTAYERLVGDTEAWDVLVNPNFGAESAIDPAEVAALPQVSAFGRVDGVGAVLLHEQGSALGSGPLVLAAADEAVLVDFARPGIRRGALFDTTDPTHVMVDDVVAERYGIAPGDRLQIGTARLEDLIEWEMAGGEGEPPLTPRDVVVTGVGTAHDGIVEDEAFAYGTIYLSHAFAERHELEPFFYGMAIRLAPGASVAELRRSIQAMAPDEAVEFKTEAAVADTVARGTMPHTIALTLFAAVVGAAGLVVAGQALSRQLLALRADRPALAAMGLDRRQLRRAAILRAALLVTVGSVLALVVAVALSPLFPLGVAERAEIDPGVDVDLAVLLPGIGLFAGTLLLWCAVRARAIAGPRPSTTGASGRSGLGERLATSLSSPIASTGLRAAIAGGATRRTGSAGAALGGLSLAVAAVAATVTFGANIDRLVSTPNEYGWSWDAMVTLPSEEWDTPGDEIVRRFDARPEITGWSVLTLDQTTLDGERIPAVGIESGRGDVGLEIIAGRSPAGDDEVALGGRTMELLDVGIGDEVRAEGRSLEVVGQAVFPGVGTYPGADRTELGKGALLTRSAIEDLGEGFGFENLIVDATDPAGLTAALDAVLADQQAALDSEEIEVHSDPALPADVVSLREVRATPLVIAGVLALLGGAAFAVVLVSGVRARRREIAVLKTFGFRARDVAGTVAWQATVTAVVAAVVGIALGTVLGRSAWSVLADALGVAGDARVPVTLLAVFAGVLVAANLLAVGPGVVAARTRPATMLRAE
jgi:hypothetical protein